MTKLRRWHVLLAGGLIGVLSLLAVPMEILVPVKMPAMQVRLLTIIQPAILVAISVFVGEVLAKRVGLGASLVDACLARSGAGQVIRRQLIPAAIVGVATAILLVIYGRTIGAQIIHGAGQQARLAGFDLPLLPKVLYGGISEELLTRWGLVSLFAWIGWRLVMRPTVPPKWLFAGAVLVAALLFGAGHLPLLFLINPHPSAFVVAAVLIANVGPGVLFGWLYVRYGIEAAMMGHALSHLLSTIAL